MSRESTGRDDRDLFFEAAVISASRQAPGVPVDWDALAALQGGAGSAARRAGGLAEPASVGYVDQAPGDDHCEDCAMFRPVAGKLLGRCTLVAGSINPRGWCRRWSDGR